jgi:hypothetical protein
MAVITAWLVKRGSELKTLNDASVLLFLLTMMATMFVSTTAYLYFPGFTTLIILVAANMVSMSVFLIPVLMTLFFGDKPLEAVRKGKSVTARTLVVCSVITLVIASEVFMGWTFAIVGGTIRAAGSFATVYSAIVLSSSSYWFIFTMSAEMGITLALLRKRFPGGIGRIIATQPVIMFLAPTAIDNKDWVYFSFVAGAIVMSVLFGYVIKYLNDNRNLSSATLGYLVCLILTYVVMMFGLILWFFDGDASIYVLSILMEMTLYFYVILVDRKLGSTRLMADQPLA